MSKIQDWAEYERGYREGYAKARARQDMVEIGALSDSTYNVGLHDGFNAFIRCIPPRFDMKPD